MKDKDGNEIGGGEETDYTWLKNFSSAAAGVLVGGGALLLINNIFSDGAASPGVGLDVSFPSL